MFKLSDFDFHGKTALVRGDLDVPLRKCQMSNVKCPMWEVEDDTRIEACLPTIEYLLGQRAKVILMGHLGEPRGRIVEELKLTPVAEKLGELLSLTIPRQQPKVRSRIQNIPVYFLGDNLWLLENLKFYPGEEGNDLEFSKRLASLGNFYVNESFAVSHRRYASLVQLPRLLPHCAGFNFVEEVKNLSRVLEDPKRPVVFIIGGAKTETKLPVIGDLLGKADVFLLGGGVANTFMVAEPRHPKTIGKSLFDQAQLENVRKILAREKGQKVEFSGVKSIYKIKIPTNLVIAKKEDGDFSGTEVVDIGGKSGEVFDQEKMIVDIGPKTRELYGKVINQAGTVVFVGPMGLIEKKRFSQGTKAVFEAMANSTAFKVVGGGDSIAALNSFGLFSKMDFVSLGGGAMLEFLAKGTLPGIEALRRENG